MFKFGVHSMLWSEKFSEKDLQVIEKVKLLGFDVIDIGVHHPDIFPTQVIREKIKEVGIDIVTTIGLSNDNNLIDPNMEVRKNGIEFLKKLVDINIEVGSKIFGGASYAAWGYLTGKPRTKEEWNWSVESMREVCLYARNKSDIIIVVEPLNRFETHFLNVAEDAVKYCKDVGTGNIKVLLDSFHMIREELNFGKAVETCGKEYLGYIHVCENNRGIPGTGLVPWKEFFIAIKRSGYVGPLVIESFDPSFEEFNKQCAIWRKFADTGEELAVKGLKNLKKIEKDIDQTASHSC